MRGAGRPSFFSRPARETEQGRAPALFLFSEGIEMELIFNENSRPFNGVEGSTMRIIEKIPIFHRLGLHLRAGAELTRLANRFKSDIRVSNGVRAVNAKSLLDLLTMGAIYGTVLEFSAEGEDAPLAIQAIRELIYGWKEENGKV
jgi:phosphocarrier protein